MIRVACFYNTLFLAIRGRDYLEKKKKKRKETQCAIRLNLGLEFDIVLVWLEAEIVLQVAAVVMPVPTFM